MLTVTPKIGLRYCVHGDVPFLVKIDQAITSDFWLPDKFFVELHRPRRYGLIAEVNNQIAGYLLYEKCKDQIDLIRLMVHPRWQRQHVGTVMITKVKGIVPLQAWVRERNLPVQLFLRKNLFKAMRIMRAHYDDTGEDAIIMRWEKT